METVPFDGPAVAPALEVVLAHLSPVEAFAVALAFVALIGTLVYAYRHHTGRCHPAATLNQRCADEARDARSS